MVKSDIYDEIRVDPSSDMVGAPRPNFCISAIPNSTVASELAASRLTLAAQESKPSGVACLQLEESPAMLQVDGVGPAATGEFVRIRVDHLATIPSVDQP